MWSGVCNRMTLTVKYCTTNLANNKQTKQSLSSVDFFEIHSVLNFLPSSGTQFFYCFLIK